MYKDQFITLLYHPIVFLQQKNKYHQTAVLDMVKIQGQRKHGD